MKDTIEEIAPDWLNEANKPLGNRINASKYAPTSMIIPEILERLEDADFQDFLTAIFIENASQLPLQDLSASNGYPSTVGCADIWMVEITERTGKVWKGKFQVEFTEERSGNSNAMPGTEHRYGELRFALNTESAEIVLKPETDERN